MTYRLGCVPYVNAAPLVWLFEEDPSQGVEVVYDVPSRLPAMLDRGEVDAILVSSHYFLTQPGLRAAPGPCIGSDGPVMSVRLFSKVPFRDMKTLALDSSSMTSSALARLILERRYGVNPAWTTLAPDLGAMLESNDAALLIGDAGMAVEADGLEVMDLGEEWTNWTGLPFVWALWVGRDGLGPDLAAKLVLARNSVSLGRDAVGPSSDVAERVVAASSVRSGLAESLVHRYLTDVMVYNMDERAQKGLERFRSELGASGTAVVCDLVWAEPGRQFTQI
ncbi:MAG: menaquinone biosynthesis protein [Armatimonadetes bacterium]|nr:menaquinone biosynthesis protein [Armatimonadota bacterium]